MNAMGGGMNMGGGNVNPAQMAQLYSRMMQMGNPMAMMGMNPMANMSGMGSGGMGNMNGMGGMGMMNPMMMNPMAMMGMPGMGMMNPMMMGANGMGMGVAGGNVAATGMNGMHMTAGMGAVAANNPAIAGGPAQRTGGAMTRTQRGGMAAGGGPNRVVNRGANNFHPYSR
jgi:RNA-binding protein Musashi